MSHDVVIVGAGIGGAVLALDLARRGRSVVIAERASAPPRQVRPEILWSATVEALDRLGAGDAIRAASVEIGSVELGTSVHVTAGDLAAVGSRASSTDPAESRARLLALALATGRVSIERGLAVDELLRDHERVVGVRGRRDGARVEIAARLVVGDDGAHSPVRRQAGLAIELEPFPIEFFCAELRLPTWLAPNGVRAFLDLGARDGLPAAAFFAWPRDRAVMLVPLPLARAERWLASSHDEFWDAVAELDPRAATPRDERVFPRDFGHARISFGHASRYVADGVAILGDAAHPVSPVGGQGANAAIWDAFALAQIANAALAVHDTSAARLARYELRRRAANRRSVAFSRRAAAALRLGARVPIAWTVPAVLSTFGRLAAAKQRVLHAVSGAFRDDGLAPASSYSGVT